MGHAPNINRNPRALDKLRAQLRSESLAGWVRKADGGLEPVETVSGCLARGAVVRGRCSLVECFRKITLDLAWLRDHGFGDHTVYEVTKQFTCGRMAGCKVRFEGSTYPGGPPLRALSEPIDHLLQFRCAACGEEGYRRSAASLLAELRRRGREDADRLGPLTLARRMRRACATCGGGEWRVIVTALPTEGGLEPSIEEAEGDAAEPPMTGRGWKARS